MWKEEIDRLESSIWRNVILEIDRKIKKLHEKQQEVNNDAEKCHLGLELYVYCTLRFVRYDSYSGVWKYCWRRHSSSLRLYIKHDNLKLAIT